ncbi:Transmembrane protein 231 [Durusdinium trenchii]|uniref:Transmembrane protein 231 n=1 Tax=Durusdinium trenchii TaxID=1381693 RepID=A0ABP0M0S5_9DINO
MVIRISRPVPVAPALCAWRGKALRGGRTGDEEMDEEGGESEDDSEASDPTIDEEDLPEANIRERPKRQTRGQRTVLDGKELLDDEDFWDRADFQDASSDSEFHQVDEESSESEDSDFSRATEQEEEPDEEKTAKKRRTGMAPPEPFPAAVSPAAPVRAPRRRIRYLPSDRSLRQSTVEQRRGSREQELVAQAKAPSRKPLKPKSSLTQEARLQEAVRTEEKSREEFKALQSQEDQRREARRRSRRRSVFEGARIRFVSKQVPVDQTPDLIGGRPGVENCVEFINCDFSDVCGKDPRSLAIQEAEHPSSQVPPWTARSSAELAEQPQDKIDTDLLVPAVTATEGIAGKTGSCHSAKVVSFTNELFLIASGDTAESAVGWSSLDSTGTQKSLQSLLPTEVKVPLVRSSHEDPNHDNIAETLKLQVEMPSTGFRSLLLLAVYNVQLRGKVSEELTGLVALDLTSPYAASGVSIYGQLVFRQKLPLFQSFEQRRLYASSPLEVNWRSNWIPENQPLTLEALLGRYAQRPEVKVCVISDGQSQHSDGFYYPSLDDTEQVLTDDQAELKGAEQDLEHGRFQDCEETCMRLLSASNDADVQRLLLHCFRCSGRAHFAWKAAEDQLERFAAQQRMDAKAKMKLSMAESCLAQGQDAKALHLAKEVYQDFRSLDLPSFEGLALLIMAAATNNAKKAEDWSCEAIEAFQIDGHSHGLGRALLQLASSASARQKAATKAH